MMQSSDKEGAAPSPLRRSARLAQARSSEADVNLSSSSLDSRQPRASPATHQPSRAPRLSLPLRRTFRNNGIISSSSQNFPAVRSNPTQNITSGQSLPERSSRPRDIPALSDPIGRVLRSSRASIGQTSPVDIPQPSNSSRFLNYNPRSDTSPSNQRTMTTRACVNFSRAFTSSQQSAQESTRPEISRSGELSSHPYVGPEPPVTCHITVAKSPPQNWQPVTAGTQTGGSGQSSSQIARRPVSPPLPVANATPSAVSTPKEGENLTFHSLLSALLKAQPSTSSAPGTSKPTETSKPIETSKPADEKKRPDEKIVLVPLQESGSPCQDVDSTDTSSAVVSDTDSSISSSLFAWSVGSTQSSNDNTHASSNHTNRSTSSSSIAVITDPEDEETADEGKAEEESSDYDDGIDEEKWTNDTSLNSVSILGPEEDELNDDSDDTLSSSWTDFVDDSENDELEEGNEEKQEDDELAKENDKERVDQGKVKDDGR